MMVERIVRLTARAEIKERKSDPSTNRKNRVLRVPATEIFDVATSINASPSLIREPTLSGPFHAARMKPRGLRMTIMGRSLLAKRTLAKSSPSAKYHQAKVQPCLKQKTPPSKAASRG